MNSKGIAIGLCLLALLGAGTYVAYKPRAADTVGALHDPWHTVERARIDHITIQRPPENGAAVPAIELEKVGGAWRMTAPGRGPTEARSVDEMVDRFADMHITGIAGRSADSYDDFQVDDAHAVHITLKAGSSSVLDAFVGADLDGGTALRVPGHPEIYRGGQAVHSMVTRAPRDWRDREITRIERDRVRGVEWVNSHGTFGFTRTGDTWAAATGTTIERLDTARVSNLVDSVANLRATDFGEGAAAGINDQSPRVTITTEGDAGPQRVTVRLGGNSGENERFVQREGNDVVFVVGRTLADSLNPEVSAFQSPPAVDGGADAAAAPTQPPTPPPGAPPPGMPPGGMAGAAGQQGIPPEVMEQIRRQLQQRGGPGGAPPGGAPPH